MSSVFDLLSTVERGGCSAKMPPGELDRLLSDLPVLASENLLVGVDSHDDASVYRISDDTALISTTDFFPPICSDPYEFGQIAAANSLSDVYAMGGKPVTALNILMFPSKGIDSGVMREILRGGADKAIEAEVVLAGGHTLDDYPPKYGLAVTGTVDPERIVRNNALRPGEALLLTKALGTGALVAGQRIGETLDKDYRRALDSMKILNDHAAEVMRRHGVRAATDVTGFSLLGHAVKMAQTSGVAIRLDSASIPALPGVRRLLDDGCIPGAAFSNLKYVEDRVEFVSGLDYNLKMLCLDAQTSGGILMSVPVNKADLILAELKARYPLAARVGETAGHQKAPPFVRIV